jgi:hypothetical protein
MNNDGSLYSPWSEKFDLEEYLRGLGNNAIERILRDMWRLQLWDASRHWEVWHDMGQFIKIRPQYATPEYLERMYKVRLNYFLARQSANYYKKLVKSAPIVGVGISVFDNAFSEDGLLDCLTRCD